MTTDGCVPASAADDGDAGATPGRQESAGAAPRVVSSATLLAGAAQIAIRHRQTLYFLRETRFGKLILTK
jgi:hemin uptake protein HemP